MNEHDLQSSPCTLFRAGEIIGRLMGIPVEALEEASQNADLHPVYRRAVLLLLHVRRQLEECPLP